MTKNYFAKSEECCPCCGMGGLIPEFRDKLNLARELAGVPFILTSAFRCSTHNEDVGGSVNSSHLKGEAVDILTPDSRRKFFVLKGLIEAGFTRIGFGENFIHVDLDRTKDENVCWDYY